MEAGKKKYIPLKDLEVYRLARKLSDVSWKIYSQLDYEKKKIMGDQFIRSADSVGANIAEGYARYSYLEKVRFYHISRGSLSEAYQHWAELMIERTVITSESFNELEAICKSLEVKLNNFISSTLKQVKK